MSFIQQSGTSEPADVVVIHETNGRKYFEALVFLQSEGAIKSLRFVGASVVWKFFHTLFRERKKFGAAIRTSLENLAFRLTFWKLRNKTVILCVAPWDYRFILYAFLRRNNRLIYNTSWPYWAGSRVPRKLGPFTWLLRRRWLQILSEPKAEITTVVSAGADSISTVANLKRRPTIISHTISDAFFKKQARYSKPLRLLFVGELSEKKGIQELPKLLDDLSDLSVAIDIIGDGPLRETAIEIAKRPNCRWHGQVANRSRFVDIAANCQIMISPASSTDRWEELFGMAILESMALGLVCIVTDHVGPRSIIRSGIDGILVPENARAIMASHIRDLHDNSQRWQAISQNALVTASKYSLHAIASQWNQLLSGIPAEGVEPMLAQETSTTKMLASA